VGCATEHAAGAPLCTIPGPMTPIIQPGQVLKIPEDRYLYGVGELRLRVTDVGRVQRMPDGDWLAVKGVQIAWNGEELREREVLVRLSAATKRRPASP
jgi:hypothetical protein